MVLTELCMQWWIDMNVATPNPADFDETEIETNDSMIIILFPSPMSIYRIKA